MDNNAQTVIDVATQMGTFGASDVALGTGQTIENLAELAQHSNVGEKSKIKEPPFIKVYTKNTVEQFIKRYMISSVRAQSLILVSPFISNLDGGTYDLKSILKRAEKDRTRVYVVTRSPEAEYQFRGIELLKQFSCVEIRYNSEIHAKLYVCWGRELEESFAFFGSGNLTAGGLRYNLELGMMILAKGEGKNILKALYTWGSHDIRVQSKVIKSIS